jgi:hypothetical protein
MNKVRTPALPDDDVTISLLSARLCSPLLCSIRYCMGMRVRAKEHAGVMDRSSSDGQKDRWTGTVEIEWLYLKVSTD